MLFQKLHSAGSHAICARVCSRNALCDFLTFPENSSHEDPLGAPFRLPFSFKSVTWRVKKGARKQVERIARTSESGHASPFPKLPWQPPRGRTFQTRNSCSIMNSKLAARARLVLENADWLGFHCNLFENLQCQEHKVGDLVLLGRGTANNNN